MKAPGIFIKIDKIHSLRIREWVHEIDWQIIVNQIEMRGVSLGHDTQPDEGISSFCRITEIPKGRGRYRPNYGDFGGGFEYSFSSHPDGIKFIAHSTVLKAYRKSLKDLEIILPGRIEIRAPSEGYGIIDVDDSRFVEGENYFGFHGDFFDLFHVWEWYNEDTHPFEFRFSPSSIGCFASVLHIESNTLLDLTKDVEW